MKRIPFFLFVFLLCYTVKSQNLDHSLYKKFDQIIGVKNTPLSYGAIYLEKYRVLNKTNHNFLLDNGFQKGNIKYRNQNFYDVDLKYDIVDDFIVVRIKDQNQIISIIPEKSLIQNFELHQLNFKNAGNLGFLEEMVNTDNYSLYKKHQKDVIENKEKNYLRHQFKKRSDQYFLFYQNEYYEINSKKDFIRIFPNQKKAINHFYKNHVFYLKNDFKSFVVKLMNQLQY
ncbi:hypothetical protein [Tenacibaculum jejuense]|uniref:Uncharacterized protein n=1 Tax=Tenacibaculum jejuense TaxID=584609 RepID=A0A238UAF6_9FLAO|nr:hypothetical protein [Tenacibaculum jejuense]SNR15390.1 conserved protein of unknown function [Tenacibaculum jejuense]